MKPYVEYFSAVGGDAQYHWTTTVIDQAGWIWDISNLEWILCVDIGGFDLKREHL